MSDEPTAWTDESGDYPPMPRTYEKCSDCGNDMTLRHYCSPSLAELQVEAVKGAVEELLTTSGSADPRTWGPGLLGEISRILDMQHRLGVMGVLADQEERRAQET